MKMRSFGDGSLYNTIEIEKHVRFNLPKDYQDFLVNFNGAAFDDTYFYVKDLKQEMMMGLLYGFNLKNAADIIAINEEFKEDILENSVLIGSDAGEGWLLLVCDGENNGIWYYDHSYFFEESTDELNTYFICETFTEFMQMLETTKPPKED